MAADYDELVDGADEAEPHVVVTDIRMPPNFQGEGIEAAKEVRKHHPGTGIVMLSQDDDPEYAIALLAEEGRGLRLPAQGPHRRRRPAGPMAVREVATGGSMLDPEIVTALLSPVPRR